MDAPFSEDLVQQFRASLDTLLPLDQPLDWQVRADQPLCLHALQAISHYMNDPDRNLFPALIEGVSTGFQDNIAPSNVFAAKPPTEEPARPELSIHWTNWQDTQLVVKSLFPYNLNSSLAIYIIHFKLIYLLRLRGRFCCCYIRWYFLLLPLKNREILKIKGE